MSNGFSEWLDEFTPDRREVRVCLDRRLVSDLVAARSAAEDAVDPATNKTDPVAAQRVADLEARVRDKSRTFVFEGLGWGRWRDILAKHPPAPDQADVFSRAVRLAFMPHAIENVGYNAETFVPAIIAASCSEPGMTVVEATQLLQRAPAGVIERLWSAVLEVNLSGGADPFVAPA